MTAFTTLTVGNDSLTLAVANEIVNGYSERRQVLGQGAISNLTAGTMANDKTLWLEMQTWLESNCTSFIDHVSGPLNPGKTDFLNFTLASWRAAAGLNASGFRRSTDGTTISYGNIQAGDVWGAWTFEDLQKGFAALKWLPGSLSWTRISEGLRMDIDTEYEDAVAKVQANWPGGFPGYTGTPFAQSWTSVGETSYLASASRLASRPSCATNIIPHICVLYMRGTAPTYESATPVYNNNGDGIVEGIAYSTQQTSSEETGTSWTGTPVGGSSCPIFGTSDEVTGYTSEGIVLIKYNFTYA